MKASDLKYLKVLQYIQKNWPVQQSQIAYGLELSLMTVNKIINEQLENKMIVNAGKVLGKSGRRSNLFKINPALYMAIGIDINSMTSPFLA